MTTLELETPYGWSDDLFAEVMADVARMLREHGASGATRETNETAVYLAPQRRVRVGITGLPRPQAEMHGNPAVGKKQ